jgi:hypothetical protein
MHTSMHTPMHAVAGMHTRRPQEPRAWPLPLCKYTSLLLQRCIDVIAMEHQCQFGCSLRHKCRTWRLPHLLRHTFYLYVLVLKAAAVHRLELLRVYLAHMGMHGRARAPE